MSQSRSILMESERINPLVMAPSFPYFIFKKKKQKMAWSRTFFWYLNETVLSLECHKKKG